MALNCSNSGQSQPFCGDHWRSRGLPDQSERHELFRLIIGRSLFEDLLICMWLSPLFPIWINLFFLNKTPQACIRSLLMVASWTCVTPASSIVGHLDFVVLCTMSTVSSPGGLEVKPFFSWLFQVASKTIWGNIAFISTMPDNALNSDRQVIFKSAQSLSGCYIKDWQTLADVLSHVTWLWPCVAGADCVFMGNAIYELLGKRKRASWWFMCCQATLRRFKKCRMKA